MANASRDVKSNEKNDDKSGPGWGYLLAAGGAAVLTGAAAYAIGYSSGKEECHQYRSAPSCTQSKKFTSATECAICIDKIKPVKILECGHSFHEKCVDPWLNLKSDCPICRAAHK